MKPTAKRIHSKHTAQTGRLPWTGLFVGLSLCLAIGAQARAADASTAPPAQSVQPAAPTENPADPVASYKQVDLKTLVGNSRTEMPGQRIIFVPSPVKFQARLAAMPAPQKTDYLKKALGMMGAGATIKVSQRIGLDYGGEKALVAYIDDTAAARLAKDGKVGQAMDFYAYHVYNHSHGPALVVVAFNQ